MGTGAAGGGWAIPDNSGGIRVQSFLSLSAVAEAEEVREIDDVVR